MRQSCIIRARITIAQARTSFKRISDSFNRQAWAHAVTAAGQLALLRSRGPINQTPPPGPSGCPNPSALLAEVREHSGLTTLRVPIKHDSFGSSTRSAGQLAGLRYDTPISRGQQFARGCDYVTPQTYCDLQRPVRVDFSQILLTCRSSMPTDAALFR